ncbi:50S ribosomal protein L33 [Candidatus Daviesbacteria bacterium RIFCSPHIGHO2_02_FULL_36_13]|uniref:Large ribosomal subunit protein bL33 n=1 Tax=Candidatus Daviesbacteria bacterium RIFCSPHIGHO2_02_FULL_36_13 TaxID=1797768 RepID=A0A1F5JMV2_9BACT|nr:MAG: 50S ribosomal protein L33 [Candidatus Daviesbacteria bacterium RIFCSPHIGHO2_02_FULL_36_13]OGE42191.1 MAG: 50S ribosomal protein L33 [Candidatus Daviesbacteria bacterium RIFCSPLOWO2_01_FULL_36_8]
MAKNNRNLFMMQCSVCKEKNYTATKNTVNIKDKLLLSKFCQSCRKSTDHQEVKI